MLNLLQVPTLQEVRPSRFRELAQQREISGLGDSVDYEPYVRTRAFYRGIGFTDHRREKRDTWECPEALYLRKRLIM